MRSKLPGILFFFLFLFQVFSFGQNFQKIDSLELVLEGSRNPNNKLEILLDIADEFLDIDPDKALEYANQAYELSLETDNDEGKLNAMLSLAGIHLKFADFVTAIDFATNSKDLAAKLNKTKELAKANYWIGNTLNSSHQLEESLDYIYESLRLFEEINDQEGIASSLNLVGVIYFKQKDFEKALEYFTKSFELNKELNDVKMIAIGLNNIANVYFQQNEYEKGIRYYMEALEINKEIGNRTMECMNYMNLGNCYKMLESNELSLEYYFQALNLAEELKFYRIFVSTQCNLANYYLAINEPEKGKEFALKAYENGLKYNMKNYSYIAATKIHEYYLSKNDIDSAYKYAIIESQLKDSLGLEETTQKLTQLELGYAFEKREQEKLREQEQKQSIYLITSIIGFSAFIIIVILLIARHRIKVRKTRLEKKEIETKLEFRDKELAVNVMSLMKKNEILTGISKELYKIRNNAVKEETKDAINKIAREIKNSSESEIWEEFELRFKQVHGDFYETLMQYYPNLTPSEQKLCAFLKLNMSSKDISELTGQSMATLEKARYRLRKKLNLPDSQTSLVSFLSKL